MPSIKDRVGLNLKGFVPDENQKNPPPLDSLGVGAPNPFIRCPLPPLNVNPDTLRQFDESGKIPARRVIPLPVTTVAGGSSTTITNVIAPASGGGATTSGTTLVSTALTLNIPALSPGASYAVTATMARAFQLLQLIVSQPVEVRVYGAALAQGADIARATDSPVPFETFAGIISDVVLDTFPYIWSWQNRIGANSDPALTSNIYITVVNPSSVSGTSASTVTISYLPFLS